MHYLRAFRQGDAPADADAPLTFVASTAGVKRDGLEIDQSRWLLGNYERNPRFLWAHQYDQRPLGSTRVWVEDGQLMAEPRFNQRYEFARDIEEDYRQGDLDAVSVGWSNITAAEARRRNYDEIPEDADDDEVWHELLDISAVPVPGDPDALAERQRMALVALRRDLDEALGDGDGAGDADNAVTSCVIYEDDDCRWTMRQPGSANNNASDEPDEERWDDVAAAMVSLFDWRSDDFDARREAAYRRLLPAYRRMGRVAPEFVPLDDLVRLDADNWRGLFLEGEADGLYPDEGEPEAEPVQERDEGGDGAGERTAATDLLLDMLSTLESEQ